MVKKLVLSGRWVGAPLVCATLAMSGCSAGRPPVMTL
jgi:hypothetical protein